MRRKIVGALLVSSPFILLLAIALASGGIRAVAAVLSMYVVAAIITGIILYGLYLLEGETP